MADSSEPTDKEPDAANHLFDLLSSARRRILLSFLDSSKQPLAVADMARDIAEHEYEESIEDLPDETIRRIHISLYHCHIPKLEDADIIIYDQDRNTVAFTDRGEHFYARAQRLADKLPQLQTEQNRA